MVMKDIGNKCRVGDWYMKLSCYKYSCGYETKTC